MYIACNDTSVIVINFRKSKTHAITDTYCSLSGVYQDQSSSSQNHPKCSLGQDSPNNMSCEMRQDSPIV